MTLLIFYLVLAIGVSFICSLCEAVLLTLTVSDAEIMSRKGNRAGARLRKFKASIDRPLAAILTLNTISHTIGAAGVGAQSAVVFGSKWLGVSSGILTLLILVVSEIIPKTIGATYARLLAVPTIWTILAMIWVSYPVVIALDLISGVLKGGNHSTHPTREQIEVFAEMARSGGVLKSSESRMLQNMLGLQETRVRDILTPRTVVRTIPGTATSGDAIGMEDVMRFSRIPVVGNGPDDVVGYVLKHDIQSTYIKGDRGATMRSLVRTLRAVPESADLIELLDQFARTGEHIFLAVDEYGGTAGVVTLEDLLESIIGAEIVDETDVEPDLQAVARSEGGSDRGRSHIGAGDPSE